jgi:glycosyltransferase involved in cell wall biosynthesis
MEARSLPNSKVLFISGVDGDTRRYRCFHQQEQLAIQGIESAFREYDDPSLVVDLLNYDLFLLHRVPYTPLIAAVIDVARLRGKPVVFETDDLLFDPTLYDRIGFIDTLSAEEARAYRAELRRMTETFQRCDCVLTTTQFLANEAQQRGKPAYVNRNAPSQEMVRISEEAFAARQERSTEQDQRPVTIGFFSGTGSHNRDFQTIAGPLIQVMEAYPQVLLHISGHLELGPEFAPFQSRIRRAPYVSWRELPHIIARVDVNLAPLEPENPFCRAKSEIKFVEAALVGVPTIASRVDAYEFAITDGENGRLAVSTDEWAGALQELVEHPEKRAALGSAARQAVYARYLPEQRALELQHTLDDILRRFGGKTAPPEQILEQAIESLKGYAEHMHVQASDREAQLASLRRMVIGYERQLELLETTRNLLEAKEQQVDELQQHLEEIRQGRVMRFIAAINRILGRTGRS